jgi:SAM-dependent methyltransferase
VTSGDDGEDRGIDAVRRLLDRAGYSADGIAAIGVVPGLGVRRPDVPILLRALEPVEPLATLVRMFLLGQPVPAPEARQTLGSDVDALAQAGLARAEAGVIVPVAGLTPWRGLVVAHDPDPAGDLWPEHVAGPTPAADTLLQLVKARGGSALDLGTGSGVLALAAARDVDEVVATDINPAALRYASLNERLNNVANIELRQGSLFDPVASDLFDLILANPPFVIAPDSAFLFRHSSLGRDELSREVVRGVARHLRPGGYGYVLVNWVQAGDGEWSAPVRTWLDGSGCDAICILHGIEDQLAYGVRWNAREQQVRPDRYAETLGSWLDHLRAEGIEAIGSGAVVLRRREGPNWVHAIEPSGPGSGNAGEQIERMFAGGDVLEDRADEALLAGTYRLPGAHRVNQSLIARDDQFTIEAATIVPEQGLALGVSVEPELIPVLLRIDGTQRLSDIIEDVAAATGQDAAGLTARAVVLVRELLNGGFAVATER